MTDGATGGGEEKPRPYRATRWEKNFLDALRESAEIAPAARAAGIERSTVYKRQRKYPEFKRRCQEAMDYALDSIVVSLFRSARDGDVKAQLAILARRRPEDWGPKLELTPPREPLLIRVVEDPPPAG